MDRASYSKLSSKELLHRSQKLSSHMKSCYLCPRNCGVDRLKEKGYCGAGVEAKFSYSPHFGEERVLVGSRGSGTIFFAHCNLTCVYCQNYELSQKGRAKIFSDVQLASAMLCLQDDYGCHNINLVTPSHYVASIVSALVHAREAGLRIPLVYNCGGYESVETLKILHGLVDIYMPDIKYLDNWRARKYSDAADYGDVVKEALIEMDRQVGAIEIYKGLAKKGLLIRHLMLPGGLEDSLSILDFIAKELSPGVLVNLMDQYYPAYKAGEYRELRVGLDYGDYQKALAHGRRLGLRLV